MRHSPTPISSINWLVARRRRLGSSGGISAPTDVSFAAIGRRLHAVADEYNKADALTSGPLAKGSAKYRACEDKMSSLLAEETALRKLVLTMQPKTLEDAAVQLGVLFLDLSHGLRNK